jgi:hypothetical protein
MPGPSGSIEPLDLATRVLEVESLGVRVRNTKRFFVLNPTAIAYEFAWQVRWCALFAVVCGVHDKRRRRQSESPVPAAAWGGGGAGEVRAIANVGLLRARRRWARAQARSCASRRAASSAAGGASRWCSSTRPTATPWWSPSGASASQSRCGPAHPDDGRSRPRQLHRSLPLSAGVCASAPGLIGCTRVHVPRMHTLTLPLRHSLCAKAIEVPFLLVGLVSEPRVMLDKPSINFGQILVGCKGHATITLLNNEHLPFNFAFDKNSYDATDDIIKATGAASPRAAVLQTTLRDPAAPPPAPGASCSLPPPARQCDHFHCPVRSLTSSPCAVACCARCPPAAAQASSRWWCWSPPAAWCRRRAP